MFHLINNSDFKKQQNKKMNLNQQWKSLDIIFQNKLMQYCETNNKEKFTILATELGINNIIQHDLLFEVIKSWKESTNKLNKDNVHNNVMTCNNELQIKKTTQTQQESIPLLEQEYKENNDNNINKNINNKTITSNDMTDTQSKINKSLIQSIKEEIKNDNTCKDMKMKSLWNKNNKLTLLELMQLEKDNIYIVEEICDHKCVGNNEYEYKIKWSGYNTQTWEPSKHLNQVLIGKYWKQKNVTNTSI